MKIAFSVCGKFAKKSNVQTEKKTKRQAEDPGICTATVFSDRFVITAAHCITDVQEQPGVTRTISIRDSTDFQETIEVKRSFVHPDFDLPSLYHDIGVFELERRIEYDFQKYGDSPTCLGVGKSITNQEAIGQGFGVTETGELPDQLLEAKVKIISNEECSRNLTSSKSRSTIDFEKKFPKDINEGLLCSIGIYNAEKKIYSVSSTKLILSRLYVGFISFKIGTL